MTMRITPSIVRGAVVAVCGVCWMVAAAAHAGAPTAVQTYVVAATVVHADAPTYAPDPLTHAPQLHQVLRLRLATTPPQEVTFANDRTPLHQGDRLWVRMTRDAEGVTYSWYDRDRRLALVFVSVVFVVIAVVFGSWDALRAVVGLAASLAGIVWVLIPALLAGKNALVWGLGVATVILGGVMFITHGIRRATAIAFAGTVGAVALTGLLSIGAMSAMAFTGLGTEEAFFLHLSGAPVRMTDLLLAGIIIGMLGVLDDIAVTQVAVVAQLRDAGVRTGAALYRRAMAVGRAHIGALVNTLVLAYAGAALPLLLLLASYHEPFGAVVSLEMVAVEVLRAVLGSIGLIVAVPLTTLLAIVWLRDAPAHGGCAHSACGKE